VKPVVLVLLFMIVFWTGCSSSPLPESFSGTVARQVTQSAHCGLGERGLAYVESADQLLGFSRLPGQNLAIEQLRQTDFAREHLLIVALGEKPTGGYSVALAEAVEEGPVLSLTMELREPGKDSMVAQVITTPCAVIAIPAVDWSEIRVSGVDERNLVMKR
jgi:protease stability complex PrcB-like protein